jgi:phosphoglycolate phosphatase
VSRLVLFDLDGTLVDSAPGIHASVRVAVAAVGLPEPSTPQLRAMVGPPLQDGFALVFGLSGPDVGRAIDAYRAHYAAGAMLEAAVYPGIRELLVRLRSDDAILAVATSKPEAFAVRILTHAGLFEAFASVHGATFDGTVRHKGPGRGRRAGAASARPRPGAGGRPRPGRARGRGARPAVHRCGLGTGGGRRAGGSGRSGDRGHPG